MKKLNYNEVRKFLYDIISKDRIKGYELYESMEGIIETMISMQEERPSIFHDLRNNIIGMLYIDSMKSLSYKMKSNIYTKEEEKLLFHLVKCNSIDNIINMVMNDLEKLWDLLKCFIELYEMHRSSKILITKSLTVSEKERITETIPNSEEDLESLSEPITLALLLTELELNETFQYENHGIQDSEINLVRIFHIIQQLFIYDIQNGLKLLHEIACTDYNILKHLLQKGLQKPEINQGISFYEENSFEIISNALLNNHDYLLDVLKNIRDVMIKQQLLEVRITLEELKRNNYAKLNRNLKNDQK